jgi:transposase-like protein
LADRSERETGGVMPSGSSSVFAGFRFPREVIAIAVRWYLRYGLSYRDVEELLAERGVTVDHVTVYRLCVPKTSSTSCDQAVFVDQATDASLSSDAVLSEIDRLG